MPTRGLRKSTYLATSNSQGHNSNSFVILFCFMRFYAWVGKESRLQEPAPGVSGIENVKTAAFPFQLQVGFPEHRAWEPWHTSITRPREFCQVPLTTGDLSPAVAPGNLPPPKCRLLKASSRNVIWIGVFKMEGEADECIWKFLVSWR